MKRSRFSTHNTGKNKAVVLGKYDGGAPTSYVEVAKKKQAQYFAVDKDQWDHFEHDYGEEQIWKINRAFLDQQIESGNKIYLSHNPEKVLNDSQDKTFFKRELQYLKSEGYGFRPEGEYWYAVRK